MHRLFVISYVSVLFIGLTHAATFVWDGAPDGGGTSANSQWSTGDNWVGDIAPANPTSDDIQFREGGSGVTNTLDANWQIGSLTYRKEIDNGNAISHTTDLGGNTLRVDGPVEVNLRINDGVDNHGSVTATLTNGTFQIGSAGSPQNLLLANPQTRSFNATLKLGAGTLFEPHIDTLSIPAASSGSSVGILDLRETTLVGGVLQVNNLNLQSGGRAAWNNTRNAFLQVSDSSNLDHLAVTGNFFMATNIIAGNTIASQARLGDPSNGYALPADVNLTIGVSSAQPGAMVLAQGSQVGSGNALLLASSGGDFVGYLSQLDVGVSTRILGHQYTNYSRPSGTLDIRNMDSVMLEVDGVTRIGVRYHVDHRAVGNVHLPLGSATFDTLTIGDSLGLDGGGLLELFGTDATVATAMTVGATGELVIHAAADSGSLTLATGATLTIDDGGRIHVVFTAEPTFADGNRHGALIFNDPLVHTVDYIQTQWLDTGKLTYDLGGLSAFTQSYVGVWEVDGQTFFGVLIPEPSSLVLLAVASLGLFRRRR